MNSDARLLPRPPAALVFLFLTMIRSIEADSASRVWFAAGAALPIIIAWLVHHFRS